MTDSQAAPAEDDESALVLRTVAGDHAAFERLMRRHNRRLYRLGRALLGDAAEAEDALQETYLAAYRSLGDFRGDCALSTWLCRLMSNQCLARLRRQARRQRVIPMESLHDNAAADAVAARAIERPEQVLARAELRALIERKLDELPEVFRTVFVLRSVEAMSIEEAAACLAVPEATVRSRHFRARALLRESLARELDLAERDVYEFGGERCDRIVADVLARLGGCAAVGG